MKIDDIEALEINNDFELEETEDIASPESGATVDPEQMLAILDSFQASLEKNIRDTLMRTVVSIENEVKKTVAAQIDQLRNELKNK